MPEAISPPRRTAGKVRESSAETARMKLLAKLERAGTKGVLTLHSAKVSEPDRATYAAALTELEGAEEVFVDRRKPKPRFFAWAARPTFLSTAEVGEDLLAFAGNRFPRLTAAAEFKKHFGKDQERVRLLPAALGLLVEGKRLLALQHGAGKKLLTLYAPGAALREALADEASATPETQSLAVAYAAAVERTGFPAVMLSEVLRESGVDLSALHRWALAEHRAGRAVLSLGDWSLATPAQQGAVLELQGERYLQVRLLS